MTTPASPSPKAPQPSTGTLDYASSPETAVDPKYRVGSLTYTKIGLITMFAWMLWGDLVFMLMESVFPNSMPLQLDRLGIPKFWISVMMVTASQAINMSLVPIISFRSDRTRTPWGRRIPYILATLPFLCVCLAALGYSDSVGAWVRASSWPQRLHISPVWMLIAIMGVLIILYDFFNVFVNSVYWYLFADVIPEAFMGRFMGAFRLVGALAAYLFNEYAFPHLETHTKYIYLGAAALYLFGFSLMCLMVREGQYPVPKDQAPKTDPWLQRFGASVSIYFRECFTHPLYISFFVFKSMWALSNACNFAKIFFYRRHLGFTMAQMGHFNSKMAVAGLFITLPLGFLVDWMRPMRAILLSIFFIIPVTFAGYFMADYNIWGHHIDAFTIYIIIAIANLPFVGLFDAADMPNMVQLLPKKQYGQFASANAMLRSFTMLFSSILGGLFIGWLNTKYGERGNAYAYLWQGTFITFGLVCMLIVYYYWRKYGGENFRAEDANDLRAPSQGCDVVAKSPTRGS